MVTLTSFAGTLRIFQILISIVALGISGRLTVNKSSLSNLTSEVNTLIADSTVDLTSTSTTTSSSDSSTTSSTNILSTVATLIKPQALVLSTSSFTTLSHTILSVIAPNLLSSSETPGLSSSSKLVSSISSGLSTWEKTYASGITFSEASAIALWFASFTYQTAKYGSWDCTNVDKLISQYNITATTTSADLNAELGIDSGLNLTSILDDGTTNSTTLNDLNSILDTLYNLTDQDVSITNWNDSSAETKQQLLIKISQDCVLKKTNIAITFLGFFTFILTGGSVTTSLLRLYTQANNYRELDEEEAESGAGKIYISGDGKFALKVVSTEALFTLNSSTASSGTTTAGSTGTTTAGDTGTTTTTATPAAAASAPVTDTTGTPGAASSGTAAPATTTTDTASTLKFDPEKFKTTTSEDESDSSTTSIQTTYDITEGKLTIRTKVRDLSEKVKTLEKQAPVKDYHKLAQLVYSRAILFPSVSRNVTARKSDTSASILTKFLNDA